MELEILNDLYETIYWEYAVLILFGTELLKLFIVKIESGNYVFRFDTTKSIQFDLRVAIIIISLLYMLVIIAIEKDNSIISKLIITFCITTTFYDYIFKKYTK